MQWTLLTFPGFSEAEFVIVVVNRNYNKCIFLCSKSKRLHFYDFLKKKKNIKTLIMVVRKEKDFKLASARNTHAAALTSFQKCNDQYNIKYKNEKIYNVNNCGNVSYGKSLQVLSGNTGSNNKISLVFMVKLCPDFNQSAASVQLSRCVCVCVNRFEQLYCSNLSTQMENNHPAIGLYSKPLDIIPTLGEGHRMSQLAFLTPSPAVWFIRGERHC